MPAASTLALSLTAGYVIPRSASTTEWATAYGWGNHASAGYLMSASIDTSAELATILGDEAGSSGGFVRAGSPTITSPTISCTACRTDTNVTDALTISGGTIGANTISSGVTWTTLGENDSAQQPTRIEGA